MARKKKKTSWFGFGSPPKKRKKKTKRQMKEHKTRMISSLKRFAAMVAAIAVFGAFAVMFLFMDRYVHAYSPDANPVGKLELVSPPRWVTGDLQAKIAASAGAYEFALDDDTARTVAGNLQNLAWIYNVKVQATDETVRIFANYRKPVAVVRSGKKKYYLSLVKSDDLRYEEDCKKVVVLDYVEIENLPVVEIKGFATRKVPAVGSVWKSEDVTTAAELVNVLARMDEISCKEKPLLNELDSIDVFNFGGNRRKKDSHIVLYTKDGTEIRWGAAYGKSMLYMEATEQEKLATLYTYYKEHNNTIQGICPFIELRPPQKIFPRPG
jgi:hypothetical protein